MKRSLHCAVSLLALSAASPVFAADYQDGFAPLRPSYEQDFGTGEDSLQFEAGVRYWYSLGKQEHQIGSFSQTMETKTNSGEAFVRIDDKLTQTYLEATGGYGIAHEGNYSTNGGANLDLPAARMGYVGADFGWLPLGNQTGGLGFVTGYQYTNDSPDTGRANFTTAKTDADIAWSPDAGTWSVGADSEINDFNVHALKLGLAGRIDGGGFDVTGEVAATPYAWVSGTYGAVQAGPEGPFGGGQGGPFTMTNMQSSAVTLNGFGYGASGKLMVGFHPTENFTIRIGGRASYLQGQYDATWDESTVTRPSPNPLVPDPLVANPAVPGTFFPQTFSDPDPLYSAPTITRQTYIANNNPFTMVRYGALLEVSGRF